VKTLNDGLDNQIVWYRVGVKVGNYAAGNIVHSLSYTVGSIDGYVRITGLHLQHDRLGGGADRPRRNRATDDWAEGEWSDRRGWPSAVSLFEGRDWWAGKQGIWGSVSDGFESFDESVEGDSGAINRDVGAGRSTTSTGCCPSRG
jgi:hypothetical protein